MPDKTRESDTDASEVELTGPIGWLFGLVQQFLLLGVQLGVALIQGLLGAFIGGGSKPEPSEEE